LAEADAELQRLSLLKKNHLDEQFVARRRVRDLPEIVASLTDRLADLTSDEAAVMAHASDAIRIGKGAYSRADAIGILGKKLESLPRHVRETRRELFGSYRGLWFGIILREHFGPEVFLEGSATRLSGLLRDNQGPRAVLNAVDRLANSYSSECVRVREDLSIAESQLRDYRARLGKLFAHDTILFELTTLRDQLRAGLAGTTADPDAGPQPSVFELAERIKALMAENIIEATSDRARQTQPSAEEAIAIRIRRRLNTVPSSDSAASNAQGHDGGTGTT
jgi:hypothetical protein